MPARRAPWCYPPRRSCWASAALLGTGLLSAGALGEDAASSGWAQAENETDNVSTTTTTFAAKTCVAGSEIRGVAGQETCSPCLPHFFKSDAGQDGCVPCPSWASYPYLGATSVNQCLCNDTSFQQAVDFTSFVCSACPPNSRSFDGASSVSSCTCPSGFIRVPASGLLESCRKPLTCDVHLQLQILNLTGPSDEQLQKGTCANITLLEHEESCSLACIEDTAPQARSNLLEAVDVSVLCEDGEITRHPAVGTWCSRGAYLLPPLIFLGTVAIASVIAGIFIERRQHRWGTECAEALSFKGSASSPRHAKTAEAGY